MNVPNLSNGSIDYLDLAFVEKAEVEVDVAAAGVPKKRKFKKFSFRANIRRDYSDEVTVDWRGKPSDPNKHGGMRAAVFVLGVQSFEIMAIAAVGNNLMTYVINEMHFSLSKSANIVTNFIGTVFILALFGGYLSDSYLGCFWTMLVFGFIELSGFILLSVQAHLPQLKPPKCSMLTDGDQCTEAKGMKALIFYLALYLVALGSGCVKPNMLAHGADQFSKSDSKQCKKLSSYFNAAYFAFSALLSPSLFGFKPIPGNTCLPTTQMSVLQVKANSSTWEVTPGPGTSCDFDIDCSCF